MHSDPSIDPQVLLWGVSSTGYFEALNAWLPAFEETLSDAIFTKDPTSSDQRLKALCEVSRGYVYLVARTGVTGRHTDVGESIEGTVERLRRCTDLPIALGFGIDSRQAAERTWKATDGAGWVRPSSASSKSTAMRRTWPNASGVLSEAPFLELINHHP